MHWFPFYSADFIGATMDCSFLERATYAWMLVLYYERREPFPLDQQRLYRLLGVEAAEQKHAVASIMSRFFVRTDDGYFQPNAENVIARQNATHQRLVEAGRVGGIKKALNNQRNDSSQAIARLKPGSSKGEPDPYLKPEVYPKDSGIGGVGVQGEGASASAGKRQRFAPPTLLEVRKFVSEHGYPVDPVKFWNHYESNGWRVGRNPMKDWHAAVRTWSRKELT